MRPLILLLFCFWVGRADAQPAKQVKPSAAQLAWHETSFYLFFHFGPNTYTNQEWGHGTEPEDVFNPEKLDCEQWCRIAKQAGAKGVVITAKHHDGFCLWPSKYSTHTVRESKWKNGKGDVVRELSDACRKYGLKFGVYLSPWDRNHPKYGTDEYNDVYANTLTELLTGYGELFEVWWDGANGEGPNGKKQVYDFHRFEKLVAKYQPNAVIFSDIGPGCRWAGNEQGTVNETNWCMLDTAGFGRGATGPPQSVLQTGQADGANWIPAECDVSIRPGWFYHPEEDTKVKTPDELFEIYLKSVGRGANLILNVPPDRNGKIHIEDSLALVKLGEKLRHSLEPDLAKGRKMKGNILDLGKVCTFNAVCLQEDIALGQQVSSFKVEVQKNGEWVEIARSTTIGARKILSFEPVSARKIKITRKAFTGGGHIKAVQVFKW